MTDINATLDGWDALANGASEGPWGDDSDEYGGIHIGEYGWITAGPRGQAPHYDEDTPQGHADAAFIAAARTIVPQATAAIRAVLALHTRLDTDLFGGLCAVCDPKDDAWPCPTVRVITDALTKEA